MIPSHGTVCSKRKTPSSPMLESWTGIFHRQSHSHPVIIPWYNVVMSTIAPLRSRAGDVTIYTRFSLSPVFNLTISWWFLEYCFKYQGCKTIHFFIRIVRILFITRFHDSARGHVSDSVPCVTDILRFEDWLCILRKSGTGLMTPSGHHGAHYREDPEGTSHPCRYR